MERFQVDDRKDDELAQSDRFLVAAREVDTDLAEDSLDRIMGKLDMRKKPEPKPAKK